MGKTSQTEEIVRLYGKIFLFGAIPYGLLMGLCLGIFGVMISFGGETSLISHLLLLPGLGLLSGILFGAFMSLVMGTAHVVAVRRLPFGKQPGALQVHQTHSVEIKLPYDEVFNLCLEFILIRGATIHLRNHEQGKIIAKTGANMKTWGNTISLNLDKLDSGIIRVMISSKPSMHTTLVDFGVDLEIVNNIAAFLKLKEEQALAKT